jgi:hypothetical protein
VPESFTEPLEIYRRCRARGMDFVTISDHDTIAGALEIQHLPGAFLSSEVTVEFPEDGCEIHCLVSGVTEEQHRDLQALRRSVYAFRDYVREQGILCTVAHPLFRVNDRLTLDHVEKLIVLFDRFEALNGMHDRRANGMVRALFGSLSSDAVLDLAERHRLEPFGATPWEKTFTGGSDDHGSLYLGTTWTETPPAATVEELCGHLRAGRHEPGGATGSSARLVQSLYAITYEVYRRQFPGFARRKDPFAELLRGLAQVPAGDRGPEGGLRRLFAFRPFAGRRPGAAETTETQERATLGSASRASRRHLARLLRGFVLNARRGRLMEGLAAVAQLAPLAVSIAPYLVAVHQLHKDADLLAAAAGRFRRRPAEPAGAGRRAWFTDSLPDADEADAMARVLRSLPQDERESGSGPRPLVALTCGRGAAPAGLALETFRPWMKIPLLGLKVALPPLLDVLDHCERERYSGIVISSPGPCGLLGVAVGRLLGIPVTGLWCTDLPDAARRLAGGAAVEELAWIYLRWLFGQAERIFVPGTRDRELLAERGFSPARLSLLATRPLTPAPSPIRPIGPGGGEVFAGSGLESVV